MMSRGFLATVPGLFSSAILTFKKKRPILEPCQNYNFHSLTNQGEAPGDGSFCRNKHVELSEQ
jgi:hypothetical protein